jgi:hypothetical protein
MHRVSTIKQKMHHYDKRLLKFTLLIASIALMTSLKLKLMGVGFFAFPDEMRYTSSEEALQSLSKGQFSRATKAIFSTEGRPADALLKMVPMTAQYITAKVFKLDYYESRNSYPIFAWNFMIYCAIFYVHFKVSKRLLQNENLVLISLILWGSLTNSFIYLRHVLPYDASLFIFYFVIYKTIEYTENNDLNYRKSFLLGLAGFFGYLVYPGYFPLFIAAGFMILFNRISAENTRVKIYQSISYALGSLCCLAIFEGLAQLGGSSYIGEARRLAGTVTQGSFEESFSFIVKYLIEVEGLTGIFLLIGLIIFTFLLIKNVKTINKNNSIYLLGFALIGLFLMYASVGYFLRKLVFYGRLLHQYLPFICLFSLFSFNELLIKLNAKKELFFNLITVLFLINFGYNFINYQSIYYPRDMAWALSKTPDFKGIQNVCEFADAWSVLPEKITFKTPTDSLSNLIVTNICYMYPLSNLAHFQAFSPQNDYNLRDSKSLFINFKAYQFEGYGIEERENIDKIQFRIKTFSR